MAQLLLLHLIAAALAPWLAKTLRTKAFPLLALVPATAFAWLLVVATDVRDGNLPTQRIPWVPGLGLDLDFRLTTLSWVVALLVTGVGALVLLYCTWYFRDDDPTLWRFTSVFTAFAGAMLGLVLTDNFLMLYVFWELTTVLSYLLIGHNPGSSTNRRAAMQALLVTTFGGLAMLVGIIAIGVHHTYSISALLADPPPLDAVTVAAVVLLLVGALSKSALVPFHFWLPGAMAAPTPVSAYLHAAAMVKAGIYLVALLAPVFAGAPAWHALTLGLGLLTMIVGGWRALRQHDIKLLLAYGTVSQLGFIVAIAGLGTKTAALAALALVLAHGLFKSTLFLVVGVVDHAAGTRDLRRLSGLGRRMLPVSVPAAFAGLSMAGVIPMAGFVSKESALESLWEEAQEAAPFPSIYGYLALAAVVVGSALTVAYTCRFLWGAFATKPGVPPTPITVPHPGFVLSPLLLGVGCLALGLLAPFESPWLMPYAVTLPTGASPEPLALWHGVTVPLLLSLVSLGVGVALFAQREAFARAQARVPALVDGERGFARTLRAVDRGAVETTAVTQRGSLPIYLASILLVFVALPGMAAVTQGRLPEVRLWDNPAQAVVGALMIAAAVLVLVTRRRLTAVMLVGATGYGVAMLFVLHGAPDLAITQMLVETVSLVVFVLALRRMPTKFTRHPDSPSRTWRLGLGAAVGAAVGVIALVASGGRTTTPVSVDFPTEAYTFGHGKNIVNVTLVDIRAWDTLGEVSVLVAAATGIASLIFVRTRNTRLSRATAKALPSSNAARGTWLLGGRTMRKEKRSVIFEVVTRLVFHIMLAASLYLLFAGHNQPGGGFAGGLVAGLALVVRYLAGGRYELDEAAPFDAGLLVGLGLLVAVGSALAPLAFGGTILETTAVDFTLWPWGEVHLVTSLVFDIGVYLIVVGMMLDIVRSLGTGIDRQIAEEQEQDEQQQETEDEPEELQTEGARP
ncbi:multisubunit sodium/proton antiporter MrpA subunit /multisubunit sodium/proton antiporter MrpB subunit [Humibacillus xanthopallidus]|uniref:Multisubunit sodium/proton antiporter MrpA subunit /multisubunit sodium/proton antiporter MrpB subunit n=1 Tax=Humibacillus xanthopallidus TaxID=412689 RepID=A0A543PXY2_9MICO|nr:Na+/H+ antiporter subunit A [Humibacillus xanthopallidus]TQN48910.1 multisubunit sodium/proton antiporter MrpA subunit /multisubunit sodium/proton antiporter MrpB subunit [Humibacillus xanthopallidus]